MASKAKTDHFFPKKNSIFFIRGSVDRSLTVLIVVILICTAFLYYLSKYGDLKF